MSGTESFSRRKGYAPDPAISIREGAPPDLRRAVISCALHVGLPATAAYELVCDLLAVPTEQDPFIYFDDIVVKMANNHLASAEWYQVYDLAEDIYERLCGMSESMADKYEAKVNTFLEKKGIGWKLESGRIETRGSEAFEHTAGAAAKALVRAGLSSAAAEIHEALRDLSRRPKPDVTGAIQHSMAALECTARQVANDPKATLGDILRRHPDLLPRPLPAALEKIWGYSSEVGRHVTEGRIPSYQEAELIVGLAAATATYLSSLPLEVPPDQACPLSVEA